ncbi:MAG: LicD family protein [Paludibacteraceae bacterium]|nr:LicD family protein [Paludibacteraceae bacterium]
MNVNKDIGNIELKRVQHMLLIMLQEFDEYCKEHNIRYTLEGGTALGAYRHQGFIPWDDDIDIRMDISEYNRFCELMRIDPPKFLRLQNHETDSLYMNGFAKLRDIRTLYKEQRVNIEYKENGCFIDIFPFEKASPIFIAIYHLMHRPLFGLMTLPLHKYRLLHRVACWYYNFLQFFVLLFRFLSKICKCKDYSYGYGCNLYTFKWKYREDIFEKTKYLKFEDKEYPVPYKIEEYLSIHYGNDYMQLPPIEKRISHHIAIMEVLDEKNCNLNR